MSEEDIQTYSDHNLAFAEALSVLRVSRDEEQRRIAENLQAAREYTYELALKVIELQGKLDRRGIS